MPFGLLSVATAAAPSRLPVSPAAPTSVCVAHVAVLTARIALPSVTNTVAPANASPTGSLKSATPCGPSLVPTTPATPATVDTAYVPFAKST